MDFDLPQYLRDAQHPAGGSCIQLDLLLRVLSRNGQSVGVLTWRGANEYVGPQAVCDLVETYDPSGGTPRIQFVTQRVPRVLAAARSYAPDVLIQSCAGIPTGMMAYVAWRLGVPFVYRAAADSDADGGYAGYLTVLEQWGYRYGLNRADLVICQNDRQRDEFHRRYPRKPLLRLDNAIDVPQVPGGPKPRVQRGYVSWLGNFRYIKNVGMLFRVARQLPHIEFHVAGGMGKCPDPETAAALEGLKSLANVRLLGYVKRKDVFALLAGSAATLCTSYAEGFPNTFLESLAMGTPVITRMGVDPNSMVARNKLGFVSSDEADMVANVRRIWDMEAADFDDLAARCRDYVTTHHSPEIVANKLIPALERLTLERARKR